MNRACICVLFSVELVYVFYSQQDTMVCPPRHHGQRFPQRISQRLLQRLPTQLYRGYPIEDLAEKGDWTDACYLLLHGELPTRVQKRRFEMDIKRHTLVHEQLIQFYKGFKHDAHPMAIMVGVVGALAAFYDTSADVRDSKQRERACMRMISKMPTLAAIAYKTSKGQPVIYPRNDLSYAENFLYMLHAVPCEPWKVCVERCVERCVEKAFFLLQVVAT